MNIIETRKLSRWYGMADGVHGLGLEVPQGSFCVLLGGHGAGKSTATKLLMNLLRPSEGDASVLGVDSRKLGPREFARIGYLADDQTPPMDLTVREWLNYCRPFYPAWDMTLERALLKQLALPLDRKLRLISRGMRVKAALLTVLAYRPKLLVLDEPWNGLESAVAAECVRALAGVAAQSECTVLAAVSEIGEFETLATRVAFLDEGRLRLNETADDLRARFRQVEVVGATAHAGPTVDWLEWEDTRAQLRFVDPLYEGEATERRWRDHFPDGAVTRRTMTLREIFVSMIRSGRVVKKAVAA
jgi:ABC-2 type transport system ATP-binding protein